MTENKYSAEFEELKRQNVDRQICALWLALRDLSDMPDKLTPADLDVWGAVTKHEAVQRALNKSTEGGAS